MRGYSREKKNRRKGPSRSTVGVIRGTYPIRATVGPDHIVFVLPCDRVPVVDGDRERCMAATSVRMLVRGMCRSRARCESRRLHHAKEWSARTHVRRRVHCSRCRSPSSAHVSRAADEARETARIGAQLGRGAVAPVLRNTDGVAAVYIVGTAAAGLPRSPELRRTP